MPSDRSNIEPIKQIIEKLLINRNDQIILKSGFAQLILHVTII